MQIDVEALRALLVVVEQGSITRAAEILQLSRSAVSWRMKRLEAHVGQELLVRDGRNIRPSQAAKAILDDAATLVETHDRIARRLTSAELTGHVTVGAEIDVDVNCLTRILGSFRRVNPGVDVDLVVDRSWNLADGLDDGRIDLSVFQVLDTDLRPDDRVLWTEPLVWVTGRATPHEEGLAPFVTYGADCHWRALSEPLLERAGIDYRVALSVPSTAGVVSAVEDGLGVGVISGGHVTERLQPWARATSLPDLPDTHTIIRVTGPEQSAVVALLGDSIAAELSPPGSMAIAGQAA